MLLRFQRKHLVETSTSSQDSDPPSKFDTIRLMDSSNPLIRLSIFGRLKKMINSYKELGELRETDRKLLRGLYLKKINDFDEQIQDQTANMTLLERLRGNLKNPPGEN